MIISLCGEEKIKKDIISYLKNIYGSNILICNYFLLGFKTTIEYERKYYEMLSKRQESDFRKYIDDIVNRKINEILSDNKDKVILLISDNILSKDIDKTNFFNKSDLKILALSEKHNDGQESILHNQNSYNKNNFDFVINDTNKDKLKKLIKL